MSTISPRPRLPPVRTLAANVSLPGVALLLTTKFLDAATTLYGLRHVPAVTESNPVVAGVLAEVGVLPGLLAMSVAATAAIAVVTEVGAYAVEARVEPESPLTATPRFLGYVLPSVIFALAALHNSSVILLATAS